MKFFVGQEKINVLSYKNKLKNLDEIMDFSKKELLLTSDKFLCRHNKQNCIHLLLLFRIFIAGFSIEQFVA